MGESERLAKLEDELASLKDELRRTKLEDEARINSLLDQLSDAQRARDELYSRIEHNAGPHGRRATDRADDW